MSSRQTKNTRKPNTTSSAARPKTTTPSSTATRTAAATPAAVDPDAPYMWTHDYDYVKKDLTKLAIVSVALFAVIIAAGFFF